MHNNHDQAGLRVYHDIVIGDTHQNLGELPTTIIGNLWGMIRHLPNAQQQRFENNNMVAAGLGGGGAREHQGDNELLHCAVICACGTSRGQSGDAPGATR